MENFAKKSEVNTGITRREFLKKTTVGAGAFLAAVTLGNSKEAAALIEKAVGADQKPEKGEPEISFEIFYSPHRTAEDVENLPEKIKEADIFVPEHFSWTKEELDIYNDVSCGKITTEEALKAFSLSPRSYPERYAHFKLIFDSLKSTQKKVEIFDVPRSHDLDKKCSEVFADYYINYAFSGGADVRLKKTFEENLSAFQNFHEGFAEVNRGREEHMLQRAKSLIENIRVAPEKYSRSGRDKIKILILLGSIHTDIYYSLKQINEQTNRCFKAMPYTFGGFEEDLMRSCLFNKKADKELVARAFLDKFMQESALPGIYKLSRDTHLIRLWFRKVVSLFNYDEIKELFDFTAASGGFFLNFNKKLEKELNQRGISIPKTEEELKTALKTKE